MLLVSVLGWGVNEVLIPVLAWTEVYASDSVEVVLMGFPILLAVVRGCAVIILSEPSES